MLTLLRHKATLTCVLTAQADRGRIILFLETRARKLLLVKTLTLYLKNGLSKKLDTNAEKTFLLKWQCPAMCLFSILSVAKSKRPKPLPNARTAGALQD